MIKLKFKEANHLVKGVNEYRSIGGLPVNIVLDKPISECYTFETIYITGNEFFIEMRFNAETKLFNQIAFVCIGRSSEDRSFFQIKFCKEKIFDCYLDYAVQEEGELITDVSLVKSGNNLIFKINDYDKTEIYFVAENVIFRVNQDNYLCEIIVLDQKELLDIVSLAY